MQFVACMGTRGQAAASSYPVCVISDHRHVIFWLHLGRSFSNGDPLIEARTKGPSIPYVYPHHLRRANAPRVSSRRNLRSSSSDERKRFRNCILVVSSGSNEVNAQESEIDTHYKIACYIYHQQFVKVANSTFSVQWFIFSLQYNLHHAQQFDQDANNIIPKSGN